MSLWQEPNGLWCPQEGQEGPGHRQVLPDGNGRAGRKNLNGEIGRVLDCIK